MNAHQRKKNAKAFIAELKACCDDEKVSSLLEAADDLRKLDKENEQLRQRVAELENEVLVEEKRFSEQWELLSNVTAERDALKQQRDDLLAAAEAIEIDAEECLDFDEFTAMLVPIDTYHKLIEAIASVKEK